MLNRKGLSPMPKDRGAVQPGSRGAREHSCAASGAHPSPDWRAEELRLSANFQLGVQQSSPAPTTRRKAEAWRINGTWTTLTICVTQSWCYLFCRTSTSPTPESEQRNPLKTEVIHHVNDLDAAPPEWRIDDVRSVAKTSAVTDGSIPLGVAVGSRQPTTDQLLSKADVIQAMRERVQLCQDPETDFALLRESLGVSRINHILRVHGHTILEEQSAAEVYDEIGHRSFERLFTGLTEDSMTQATLSASQSGIRFKRARDIAAPAHLGALITAKPRIQAMIRDAAWAGLLPEQILEARSPPISAHLTVMSKQRRSCMFRRQPRQQTKLGSKQLNLASRTPPSHPLNTQALPPKMRAAMTWTSRCPGRADSVRRSSKRSSHDH